MGDADKLIFHDDGVEPDIDADDKIYSAYLQEDIDVFKAKMVSMESRLSNEGSFVEFTGHVGTVITEIPHFKVEEFEDGEEVELDKLLLNGLVCNNDLLKQNTLFITDLAVVEDQARTYNVVTGQGLPMGVWTFGNLIKNIANPFYYGGGNPDLYIKDFLRSWLRYWTTAQAINGETVPKREDIIDYLIEPWLRKCNPQLAANAVNIFSWENVWNSSNIDANDLLKYAPFKLTAIVNRLDLRGNSCLCTRAIRCW